MTVVPQVSFDEARPDPTRSAVLVFGTSLLVGLLSLVNVLVTSRGLGVAGRGQVAFLLTVGSLVANVATLGVQEANANIAGQAPRRTGALAGNSVLLSLVFGGGAALLVLALVELAPAVGGSGPRWLLWLVLACLPVLVLHIYLQQIAVAHYCFGVLNGAVLLTPVLNVVVNSTLAALGVLTVAAAVGIWLVGQLLSTAVYVVVIHRRLGGFARPEPGLARRSLRFGVQAHLGRSLTWSSYRLDQWVVGAIGGDRMLGHYSVAVAWAEVLFLLPQALQTVLRPDQVRASRRDAQRLTATVVRLALLLTLPAALTVALLAPFLCVTLLGPQFAGAVTPLRVLVPGAFGVLLLKVYGGALLARGRPLLDSLAVGPALVVMLVLDVVLVPVAGATGAAIASSVSYAVGGALALGLGLRVLGGTALDLVPRRSDVRTCLDTGRAYLRLLLASRH